MKKLIGVYHYSSPNEFVILVSCHGENLETKRLSKSGFIEIPNHCTAKTEFNIIKASGTKRNQSIIFTDNSAKENNDKMLKRIINLKMDKMNINDTFPNIIAGVNFNRLNKSWDILLSDVLEEEKKTTGNDHLFKESQSFIHESIEKSKEIFEVIAKENDKENEYISIGFLTTGGVLLLMLIGNIYCLIQKCNKSSRVIRNSKDFMEMVPLQQ